MSRTSWLERRRLATVLWGWVESVVGADWNRNRLCVFTFIAEERGVAPITVNDDTLQNRMHWLVGSLSSGRRNIQPKTHHCPDQDEQKSKYETHFPEMILAIVCFHGLFHSNLPAGKTE